MQFTTVLCSKIQQDPELLTYILEVSDSVRNRAAEPQSILARPCVPRALVGGGMVCPRTLPQPTSFTG